MNRNDLQSDISSLDVTQTDTSTQTSIISLNVYRSPLFTDINKLDNNSVNVLKLCHNLQDFYHPKTGPIVNGTDTEGTKNVFSNQGQSNSLLKQNNSSAHWHENDQKFIKPQPEDKTDYSEFDDILLKALDSVSKGLTHSDCSTNSDLNSITKTKVSNIGKVESNYLKMETNKDSDCSKCEADAPSTCQPDQDSCTDENARPSQIPTKENLCGTLPPKPESKCVKKVRCKPKIKKVCSKESVNKCDKESYEAIESPHGHNETNETEEYENEIVLPHEGVSHKSFAQAHNETMSIIKSAMEDFIGKVYKTTQDAVTLIATESAKQLVKAKFSEAINTNIRKRESESKDSDAVKKFNYFRNADANESEERTDELQGPGAEVVERILTKVDSAFTVLSEHISKSFEHFPKSSNYDNQSSPYDTSTSPNDVAHLFTPEPTPNMFSAIKSKIVSIFCDVDPKVQDEDTLVNVSSEQDDDENLIEKFIE